MSFVPAPRRLYYVPIVHTQEDLGSLAASAQAQTTARLGSAAWEEKQRLGAEAWAQVTAWAASLPEDLRGFRLYQDGLPVCGFEEQIVKELAARGSPNHGLLMELMRRGATLMGTESPQLLQEEYQLAQALLAAPAGRRKQAPGSLLARRDAFLALRIAQTLQPGENGILFIGALHRVERHLPADIDILFPLRARAVSEPTG